VRATLPKKKYKSHEVIEIKDVRVPIEGEVLGVVERMVGNDKLVVNCTDGKTRLARIRGKFKKKVWIRNGDIVLVAPWDFQDDRADIVWRYNEGEVKWLKSRGYLSGLNV